MIGLYCFKCGSEIDDGSLYCSRCGAKVGTGPERFSGARKRVFIIFCACVTAAVIATAFAGVYFYSAGGTSATTTVRIVSSVINDLRKIKNASLMYYGDNLEWPRSDWPDGKSLDRYMDIPSFFGSGSDGALYGFSVIQIAPDGSDGYERTLIGLDLETGENASLVNSGVRESLSRADRNLGLLNENGGRYDGGRFIYVLLK
jgi:hypothetical protein